MLSKYTASRIEVLETTLINFQSVYAVEAYNTSLVISWMDVIFENQNQLYDFQTMDKNRWCHKVSLFSVTDFFNIRLPITLNESVIVTCFFILKTTIPKSSAAEFRNARFFCCTCNFVHFFLNFYKLLTPRPMTLHHFLFSLIPVASLLI